MAWPYLPSLDACAGSALLACGCGFFAEVCRLVFLVAVEVRGGRRSRRDVAMFVALDVAAVRDQVEGLRSACEHAPKLALVAMLEHDDDVVALH